MKEEFVRFATKNTAGRIFTVIGYQRYVIHKPVYGTACSLKGDIEYWTDTGLPVSRIDSETYKVSATKELVTRFY